MSTDPANHDARIRRILTSSRLWLTAGSGMLWWLGFGIGAVLITQVVRGAPTVDRGLTGFGGLFALVDVVVLLGGVGVMALTLGQQARSVQAALDGEGSLTDVLRLTRRFWWTFALTLLLVSLLGCGALVTGATGAIREAIEQSAEGM